uniref:RibD family protein n=1 Tax=Blastomonas sp. TaxID=1909299 RepID=UPI003593329A
AGLESRSPQRVVLSHKLAPEGWTGIGAPEEIATLAGVDWLLVEGGAETAAAFLRAGLVDQLLLYRAPNLLGAGMAALGDIGLADLAAAHRRWRLTDTRMLGIDRMESYQRIDAAYLA